MSRLMLSLLRPAVLPIMTAARDEMRRCVWLFFLKGLAALFALLAFVMFAAGLFLYLREFLGAPIASSIVGGGLLIISGLIAAASCLLRGDRPSKPSRGEAPHETASSYGAGDVPEVKDDPFANLQLPLAALLVGCVVGSSPDVRQGIATAFLMLRSIRPQQNP